MIKNWKYNIKIKDQFKDHTTPELIVKLCTSLSKQIKSIMNNIQGSYLDEEEIDYYYYELESIEDNFDFLRKLADGTINENDWGKYGFDGDFETEFNGYLSELYDLADNRVLLKSGEKQKFIWIE